MERTTSVKITKSTCWGLGGCDAGGCGWELHTSGGKLVKVEGDEDCPDNRGRLCARALGALQYVNHPDRLKYPMKRVGKRGEGKWETISWDEAYDIIVKKLKEIKNTYGPESVIFCQGTGRDIQAWISRLAYSYGSPNWNQATLGGQSCFLPRVAAAVLSFGDYPEADFGQFTPQRFDNPEFTPPKYAIVWGKNPVYSHSDGFHGYWLVECMRRGTKIICVDPRLTWIAARSDVWLQLRPGTDAALALGMLNVIINEELYDKSFVEKWCYGFEQLKQRAQEYPPEKASNITWVPAEKIEVAARLFATNKPSALLTGVGMDQQIGAVANATAVQDLLAITGNVEVPGGNVDVGFALAPTET
ncbi:MAG: molybdopterin-dependent oxidoreductase, partial [Candidatus Bathyarchaeia archaeon]